MARLIQMRQRIKAIETIKKITHTMRLISMSTHTKLKTKDALFKNYKEQLTKLFEKISPYAPSWSNPLVNPPADMTPKTLVVLVGSQRGLCGSFNNVLFTLFALRLEQHPELAAADIIGVGKKAADYLKKNRKKQVLALYETISPSTIATISTSIAAHITSPASPYTRVVIFSNEMKTFFAQVPRVIELLPFTPPVASQESSALKEYVWEEAPEHILDALIYQLLETSIYGILFGSLLSEQAARFLSMDGATRNAEGLLETTKLQYNKLRQAKITKELSELTGSF